MNDGLLLSLLLGAGLALLHALASMLTHRQALRMEGQAFFVVYLGGMILRLLVVLGLLTLLLVLAPVSPAAFLFAFFVGFVISMSLELARITRLAEGGTD